MRGLVFWLGSVHAFTLVVSQTASLVVSSNPSPLFVYIGQDGAGSAEDSFSTYTVSANAGKSKTLKITGAITSGGAMPTNTALKIYLSSSKGTSSGSTTLTTTAVNLVTNLPGNVRDTGSITYTFLVTSGWTVPAASLSRVVTLTLLSN